MDKKIILVGAVQEKKDYSKILNLFEIRNKKDLESFIKNDFLFGFCHGSSCENIKELLEIDEKLVQLININDFSFIEEKNDTLEIKFLDEEFSTNSTELSNLYFETINNLSREKLTNDKSNIFAQVFTDGIPMKQMKQFIGEENNRKNTGVSVITYALSKKILDDKKSLLIEYPKEIEISNNIDSLNFSIREDVFPTEKEFKIQAKKFKISGNFKSLGHAQNALANKYGYKDYNAIKPNLKKELMSKKDNNKKYSLIPYQNHNLLSLLVSNYGSIFNKTTPDIDILDLLKQKKEVCFDFTPLENLEESIRLKIESRILKSVKTSPSIKILRSKININAEDDETKEILDRATIIVNLPILDDYEEKIGKASFETIKKYLE